MKKLVIVSGYFNPLHKGHLELFHMARDKGHKLFVIVNSDYQRSLKGSKEWHKIRRDHSDLLESVVAGTEYIKYLKDDNTKHENYQVLAACPSNSYYLGSL